MTEKDEIKRVFVTGGSGFLGRNLIPALRKRGYAVKALARTPHSANTVESVGAEPVFGDLNDYESLVSGMSGCISVFHAAAIVDDWGRYEDMYRVNVEGTRCVLNAARSVGVRRFIYVSTEAVLIGGPPIRNADETWPRPKRALGPYSVTKGKAEELVLAMNSVQMQTMAIRPRFIWGKGDTSVLAKMQRSVESGTWMWINGGRYLTSTCHVSNVCEAIILAHERGRGGEIYFVTDGEPVEFRDFVTRLLRSQGLEPGEKSIPRWMVRIVATCAELVWTTMKLSGRPPITRSGLRLIGEEVTINDEKARRELGYAPVMTIKQGLEDMLRKD